MTMIEAIRRMDGDINRWLRSLSDESKTRLSSNDRNALRDITEAAIRMALESDLEAEQVEPEPNVRPIHVRKPAKVAQ